MKVIFVFPILAVLCACGGGPSISTSKAADVSETFTMYADALDRVGGRWTDGLTADESELVHGEIGTVATALRDEASGIKTDATMERVEGLGAALASTPFSWTKAAGWAILAGAALFGFGRKKKTSVSGVGR